MEFRLIDLIRKNDYLYDKTSPLYKNREAKERKWKEISDEMGIEVIELQKRWRTLRDRFKREDKRYSRAKCTKNIKWRYYKPLLFLKGYCEDAEPKYPKVEDSFADEAEVNDYQYTESEYHKKDIPTSSVTFFEQQNSNGAPETQNRTTSKKKRTKRVNNPRDQDIVEKFKTLLNSVQIALPSTSMVRAFFNSMAIQVEAADLTFERFAFIQQEILRIVNEQIREQRQEESTASRNCQNFVDI